MSATGRNKAGKERDPFDYYPTPAWCVDRLVEACPFLKNSRIGFLEPCAGDGAILRALGNPRYATAYEIQDRFKAQLKESTSAVFICDALEQLSGYAAHAEVGEIERYDVAITNPPFGIAFEMLKALWPCAEEIFFLLRLSFLASEDRQQFLHENPPSLYVLPNRPIFTKGTSDNCDYAWMRWSPWRTRLPLFAINDELPAQNPVVRILNTTPKEIRCARNNSAEQIPSNVTVDKLVTRNDINFRNGGAAKIESGKANALHDGSSDRRRASRRNKKIEESKEEPSGLHAAVCDREAGQ